MIQSLHHIVGQRWPTRHEEKVFRGQYFYGTLTHIYIYIYIIYIYIYIYIYLQVSFYVFNYMYIEIYVIFVWHCRAYIFYDHTKAW